MRFKRFFSRTEGFSMPVFKAFIRLCGFDRGFTLLDLFILANQFANAVKAARLACFAQNVTAAGDLLPFVPQSGKKSAQ